MYSNNAYDVEVNVALENGVYVLDGESAIGKTWLCKVLRELRRLGEPVVGYTYQDDKLGIDLEKLIESVKPVVIMLDRYDMYKGMFDTYLEKWGENSIVLVDCKGILNVDTDWCCIEMSARKLVVVS